MLVGSLSVLVACTESIGSVEPPILSDPPDKLVRPCARPGVLPDRELTQAEVEFFWINDRERLIRCGLRLRDLIAFYQDRDARIVTE